MNLEELETRLQALIEVHLVGALTGGNQEGRIGHELAQAIRNNIAVQPDGTRLAPDTYTLGVPAGELQRWNQADASKAIIDIIKTIVQEAGLKFNHTPVFAVKENSNSNSQTYNLTATFLKTNTMDDTQNTKQEP